MKDTGKDFSERFASKIDEAKKIEEPQSDNKIKYSTKSKVVLLLTLKK